MNPLWAALLCITLCVGCQTAIEHRKDNLTPNPMPSLWGNVVKSIDDLETNHASINKWEAAADGSERIETPAELDAALSQIGFCEIDRRSVLSEWGKWSSVVHYGFEENYHALVFFAKGRAYRVIKW